MDQVVKIGRSTVQHGPHNQRAYLMKLAAGDLPGIIDDLDRLAADRGYSKIFAKVPASALEAFREAGYILEAAVPDFFREWESGCFLGRFVEATRAVEPAPDRVQDVLEQCRNPREDLTPLDPHFTLMPLDGRHVDRLAALYGEVFTSYPFPIDTPEFLRQSLDDHTIYYGVFEGDRLVAASSAEVDTNWGNAEMTDFATLPIARGNGLAGHLLARMEADLEPMGIRTLYTIARATSYSMNITFARAGYVHAGTLVANTQIMGRLESMNVWYRRL